MTKVHKKTAVLLVAVAFLFMIPINALSYMDMPPTISTPDTFGTGASGGAGEPCPHEDPYCGCCDDCDLQFGWCFLADTILTAASWGPLAPLGWMVGIVTCEVDMISCYSKCERDYLPAYGSSVAPTYVGGPYQFQAPCAMGAEGARCRAYRGRAY